MNMSSPTLTNLSWNIPVMSRVTGSGTGPVFPLPRMLCALAGSVIETINATAANVLNRCDRVITFLPSNRSITSESSRQPPDVLRQPTNRAFSAVDVPVRVDGDAFARRAFRRLGQMRRNEEHDLAVFGAADSNTFLPAGVVRFARLGIV